MGSTIDSYISTGVTLGSGAYGGPLTITQTGTIYNGTTALFIPTSAAGEPVYNYGLINGGVYGVSAQSGGTIVVEAGGVIRGQFTGVYLNTPGTVINAGIITGANGPGLFGFGFASNSGYIASHFSDYFRGTFFNSGTITVGFTGSAALYMGNLSYIENSGQIGGAAYGVRMRAGGTLVNAGMISGTTDAVYFNNYTNYYVPPGLLIVDPGAVFNGNVVGGNVNTGLELAGGTAAGTLDMGGTFFGFGTIAIDTNAAWTLEGTESELAAGQSITGFSMDDTLVLDGFVATSIVSQSGDFLVLTDGSATKTLRIDRTNPAQNFAITDIGGTTQITVCYAAGTRIATPSGETAVEDLRAGDMVLTANGPMPVRWLGRSDVCKRFADELRDLPVRIRAGALGEALPQRDLLVSPEHALFIESLLVQAGALVDGVTILRERDVPEFFSYFHVELASHELLLAEGVWAESFVDHVDRRHFHNWDERSTPALPIAELPYPRVKSARQLPLGLRRATAA